MKTLLMKEVAVALPSVAWVAQAGLLAAIAPEGATAASVTAALMGSAAYVVTANDELTAETLLRRITQMVGLAFVCFVVGVYFGPAIVGNVWLLNKVEVASFAAAIAGLAIVKGLPMVFKTVMDAISKSGK